VWGTAKLAWKLQLRERYAIVGGVGATFVGSAYGVGGDFGVIASTKRLENTPLQLYSAVRLTMMLGNGVDNGGGVLSGGLMWNLTARWRLAFEVGAVGGGGTAEVMGMRTTQGWFGAYGAAVISHAWTR
jgi:hypothetical protein